MRFREFKVLSFQAYDWINDRVVSDKPSRYFRVITDKEIKPYVPIWSERVNPRYFFKLARESYEIGKDVYESVFETVDETLYSVSDLIKIHYWYYPVEYATSLYNPSYWGEFADSLNGEIVDEKDDVIGKSWDSSIVRDGGPYPEGINMKKLLKELSEHIDELSDGYHTFEELYQFRMYYNAAFFNEYVKAHPDKVVKSKRHHDGELCFGGGWFIVMASLPSGQISNHYRDSDWKLFDVPEVERAPEWDGHTPKMVLDRLYRFLTTK